MDKLLAAVAGARKAHVAHGNNETFPLNQVSRFEVTQARGWATIVFHWDDGIKMSFGYDVSI
jgi:hypothetical protein